MRFRPLGWGLLAGLWAGLAMAVVSAILRLFGGVSLHSELVGDLILPHLPVDLFLAMLGRAGGPLMAKQLAIVGDLPGLVLAGMASGLLFAAVVNRLERTARPGRAAAAFAASAVVVAWIGSVAVFWPVAWAGYTGLPPAAGTVATAAGLLFTYSIFGAALLFWRRMVRRPEPGVTRSGAMVTRRAALFAGTGVAMAVAGGGLTKVLLDRSDLGYDGLQYRGMAAITPTADFYVVTKNLIDPKVDLDHWRLEITGLVEKPAVYDLAQLRRLTATEQEMTLECISNYVGGGLISNAGWKGVLLQSLLQAARVHPGATQVNLRSVDGYTVSATLEEAMDPAALIAYEMNGQPLPDRHGFPLRALMPRNYGEFSAKWLTRIEVARGPEVGYYETQGWRAHFVHTMSRFTSPRNHQILNAGSSSVRIAGIAYAGGRGISMVELSTDGGVSWRPAGIERPGTRVSWTLWNFPWTPPGPGAYDLAVRATDADGNAQTARDHGTAPAGATGFHRITVRVA